MLLSEIVYNIKNLMAGGIESDDENLSSAQVAFIVDYYRARLIKNDLAKGRLNKQLYVQNLGLINLKEADKNECEVTADCILRSENKIPIPSETAHGMEITFVGTTQGRPFNKYFHNSMFWKNAAKFSGKEPGWYYQGGYLYIIDPPSKMFSNLNIQGIFEDPTEAENFKSCGEVSTECSESVGFDYEYPMPKHHVDTLVKLFADTELRMLTAIPTDTSNDSLNQLADRLLNAKR